MYPEDSVQRRIGDRARQILHYQIDVNNWLFKEETGSDFGRDCILELSEDNQLRNHKIEGQIKGTRSPNFVLDGNFISFPLEVKTVNYAMSSPISFVLFVVDVLNEVVYFQCIQDYFNGNEMFFKKINSQKTINIRIPIWCCLRCGDNLLQGLAHKIHHRYDFNIQYKEFVDEKIEDFVKC